MNALFNCVLASVLSAFCCCYLQAQQQADHYLGTKTPYLSLQKKHTPPPAGFSPVFINYVGRHGARFMTKPGSNVLVTDVLQQAAQQSLLTSAGQQLQQSVAQFDSVEQGNYESITQLGADEQTSIAKRMYEEYKTAFKQGKIDVLTTTKVRTQQSANAFLLGGPAYTGNQIHRTVIADTADEMLRFYDMSPAYNIYKKSKIIQQHIDSLTDDNRMNIAANDICKRLFITAFNNQLLMGNIMADDGSGRKIKVNAIDFAQALYDVYAIHFSAYEEIKKQYPAAKDNFEKAFTKNNLQWLSLVNDATDFYTKGPAEDTLGIQVTIAAPLLVNFITTTDSIVNGSKQADAVLRFTHAEAISPFATLLGIPEASAESHSVYTFQQGWQASQIIPLSGNIQWILYTNRKQYAVKVLLNEKEVKLPVETSSFPYYNWQAVRQYYVAKLNKLGINLQSDRKAFLPGANAAANQ